MSSPEDNKIDFEKLKLSDSLSDSLEPIGEQPEEQPLPEHEAEAAAGKTEEAEADESKSDVGESKATEKESKFKSILTKLSAADPFNVMLSLALAALLIAVIFCMVELGRYHFQINAKKTVNTITMSSPIDSNYNVA